MRIAFFTEAYDPFINGVVVLVKHFRRELMNRGHEVVVFTPDLLGYDDDDEFVVRLPSVFWSSQAYPFVRPCCYNMDRYFGRRFDLIHSHHPFSTGLMAERAARRLDVPLIHTFHTLLTNYTDYVPILPKSTVEHLAWAVCHRHVKHTQMVTVSTPVMARFLAAKGVRQPIRLVTPTHQLPDAAPDARERLRREWGLPDHAVALMYAGRLAKEKCVEFLLRSAARLAPELPWRVVMVGGGPIAAKLPGLAEELGIRDRVVFTGEIAHEQMADVYAAADVFTFPSKNETYGLVLLEAMSRGLPVVAIAENGPLDIVDDDHTGILTPYSERRYAEAMARLLRDPARRVRMGQAARLQARKLAAVATGDQLLAAYAELLRPTGQSEGRGGADG